ncbi:MAG: histone deacetylase family protein [Candidatus Hodarchaeales archaeon]|jgi:acetoin utilization deacetylase AcuC-like enzyme
MNNRIIFHEDYYHVYASDPAADSGRLEAVTDELQDFEFIKPDPALDEDILLVHTENHLSRVKGSRGELYYAALLAAGGAILASEIAYNQSEAIFALIRPPGHHASPEGFWGFCYFNNIAIAINKLLKSGKISKAIIIDFDLHFGDGTANTFSTNSAISYYHVKGNSNEEFIENLEKFLHNIPDVDIIGVSAGFDRHIEDWGGLLTTNNYRTLGTVIKMFAEENCNGKRFAVLEGGYNHNVLGKNVKAFIQGFY